MIARQRSRQKLPGATWMGDAYQLEKALRYPHRWRLGDRLHCTLLYRLIHTVSNLNGLLVGVKQGRIGHTQIPPK